MGEAQLKKRRKRDFLKHNPICCYCGGLTPAATVDHVPSIQMFSLRRRPRGLEVPACEGCNRATRQHEQVAALFGRIFPDGRTAEERDELQRIMRSVNSNNPGLLEEMMPSRRQEALFCPIDEPATIKGSGCAQLLRSYGQQKHAKYSVRSLALPCTMRAPAASSRLQVVSLSAGTRITMLRPARSLPT